MYIYIIYIIYTLTYIYIYIYIYINPNPRSREEREGSLLRPHLRGETIRPREREFFIDNLLVRIHLIIVMIRWTGLASSEFEFPLPCSLTFLVRPTS